MITYRKPTTDDIQDIVDLSDVAFGPGWFTPDMVEEWMGDIWLAVFSFDSDKDRAVGYSLATVNKDGVGVIDYVIVDPDWRRNGIGMSLVAMSLSELDERGIRKFESHAWEYPDGSVPIAKSLEHFNFRRTKHLNQWYADGCGEEFTCTERGDACECRCSAWLYELDMDEDWEEWQSG